MLFYTCAYGQAGSMFFLAGDNNDEGQQKMYPQQHRGLFGLYQRRPRRWHRGTGAGRRRLVDTEGHRPAV